MLTIAAVLPARRDLRQAAPRLRRLGLFAPAWVDPATGYRRYSPAQLPELRRILALRQLGMPLDEIGSLVRGGDLRAALDRRRAELERERRLVDERLAALDITVAGDGAARCRRPPFGGRAGRDALVVSGSVPDAFFELESHVRDAGRRAHRPPGAIPAERRDLRARHRADPRDRSDRLPSPAGHARRVRHPPRADYRRRRRRRATLARWVDAADLAPSGPMRTLYLQFGAEPELRLPPGWVVEPRRADLVTELQLPVE